MSTSKSVALNNNGMDAGVQWDKKLALAFWTRLAHHIYFGVLKVYNNCATP